MVLRYLPLLLMMALGLSACAPAALWDKPGATKQDFAKDSYECERDMRQGSNYGTGFIGGLTGNTAEDFQERCMIARGYQRVR